jgi:hypothetical protein
MVFSIIKHNRKIINKILGQYPAKRKFASLRYANLAGLNFGSFAKKRGFWRS